MALYRCEKCGQETIRKRADGTEPWALPCGRVVEVTDILKGESVVCDGQVYRQDVQEQTG